MKEGFITESITEQGPGAEDMEKINRYTRRPYSAEEVFVFSMVLCDNQVDRDGERFPAESLERLGELFLGKTCLFDHQRLSSGQTARIFDTALEQEGETAEDGEPLTRLTARAYLPRTRGTEEVVELIDSGMLKEVSVSCSVARRVCSLCGQEDCGHEPGEEYGGQRAYRLLLEPTDAYECSFVAVPAQKGAGVVKKYGPAGHGRADKQWHAMEEDARWGRRYRENLTADILKYSALVQPELPREVMKSAVKGLTMQELASMGRTYERMAQKALPLKPQLAVEKDGAWDQGNRAYKI